MPSRQLIIFDTTLRDGEQAPGFSHADRRETQAGAPARGAGRRHHRGRFPDCLRGRRRGRASSVHAGERPGHRGAGALPSRRHRTGRLGARAAPSASRIHVFIATSDLHLERKLRMTRAGLPATRRSRPCAWRARFTDDVQFSAEDATRSDPDFLWRVVEGGDPVPARTTINLPDTVGYSTPDEIRDFFAAIVGRVPSSDQVDLQHALPRRSRSRRRQYAGGARRRRPPGRVHDQRHRRACRQRLARRGRDGDARAIAIACRSTPASIPARSLPSSQLLTRPHRRSRPGQQGHRRAQRLRARGGHPPGRHAEGPSHLRDHASRRSRRAGGDARPRQAFRPSRGAAPLRADRRDPRPPRSSIRSTVR